MKRHAESVCHQYSATYKWTDDEGAEHTSHWSALCSGANQALSHLHAHIQRSSESNADRKVVRPKLRHDQYQIISLEVVYTGVAGDQRGEELRQRVEIPVGVYPDLRHHKIKPEATAEFGFVKDLPAATTARAERPVFAD